MDVVKKNHVPIKPRASASFYRRAFIPFNSYNGSHVYSILTARKRGVGAAKPGLTHTECSWISFI